MSLSYKFLVETNSIVANLFEEKEQKIIMQWYKSLLALDKEARKFLRLFDKKYGNEDMIDDPQQGDPGYNEFNSFFKKHDAKKKSIFSNVDQVIDAMNTVIASGDRSAISAIGMLDKNIRFDWKDLVDNRFLTRDQSKGLQQAMIMAQRSL